MGLVVCRPDFSDYIRGNKIKSKSSKGIIADGSALTAGEEAGAQIRIRKGVGGNATESGRLLTK